MLIFLNTNHDPAIQEKSKNLRVYETAEIIRWYFMIKCWKWVSMFRDSGCQFKMQQSERKIFRKIDCATRFTKFITGWFIIARDDRGTMPYDHLQRKILRTLTILLQVWWLINSPFIWKRRNLRCLLFYGSNNNWIFLKVIFISK